MEAAETWPFPVPRPKEFGEQLRTGGSFRWRLLDPELGSQREVDPWRKMGEAADPTIVEEVLSILARSRR